ncbi:MAG: carboxypeptidase regulatory-like domain-containing protein [Deltaproteobacteria bacterium]
MRWRTSRARRVLWCVCLSASAAAGQSPRRPASGYFRVPVVADAPPGALLTSAIGYGFTESLVDAPGSHHRMNARIGATLTPLRGLDLGMATDVRHDVHSAADDRGSDQGTVLGSELSARVGKRIGSALHLGLGLAASFPGGVDVPHSLENPALEAQLLAGYLPADQPWSLGALAGFRYDRSASAVLDPRAYRAGDRLALGSSAFNGIPLGIRAAYRWGQTEWIAELSANVLVGSQAPRLSQSPWRWGGGAHHGLSERIALSWLTEAALSARPATGASDPLSPVEPRFRVLVGFAYTILDWERDAPLAPVAPARIPAHAAAVTPPPPAATSNLLVNVTTLDGYPLSDATVELQIGQTTVAVPHRNLESYVLGALPSGEATLRVSAPRLKPQVRSVRLQSGAPLVVTVQLEAAPPSGQLQGLVRTFGGQGLRARIRIEPTGVELFTSDTGTFLVDVAPGRYVVTVEAPGHESQRKRVEVGPDGVVILNADLSKGSP